MDDSQDVDLVRLDVVDDPVGTLEDLADLIEVVFGDLAARERKGRDLLRASCEAIEDALGVGRRVLRDVGVDGVEMLLSRVPPATPRRDSS